MLAATDLAKGIGWIVLFYLVGMATWVGGLLVERRKRRAAGRSGRES